MQNFAEKTRKNSERGAALAEFAVVLPLILIFLTGITELNQVFDRISGQSRITYEAVLTSGQVDPDIVTDAVQYTYDMMNKGYADHLAQSELVGNPEFDLPNQTVKISTRAQLIPFLPKIIPLNFNISYIGPQLRSLAQSTTDLESFSNDGIGPFYDCHGNPTSNPLEPCV